jgi:integrase
LPTVPCRARTIGLTFVQPVGRGAAWWTLPNAESSLFLQLLRRLFELRVKPGRPRSDNPVTTDLCPRKDNKKIYGFLYPNELLAALGCELIPLARRVYYALATYSGLRKGSLAALTWDAVDFEHRTLTSLVNKNGVPQIFALSDATLPRLESLLVLLKRWHEHRSCPGADERMVSELGCRADREAETLRGELKLAGITRAALFSTPLTSKHCGFTICARLSSRGRAVLARERVGLLIARAT